jgi:hypothetical protein
VSIYISALSYGLSRLYNLPRLTIPLVLSIGLTLGGVLSAFVISSLLLLKPINGVKESDNLYTFNGILNYNRVNLSFLRANRFEHYERALAPYGTIAAIRTSSDTIKDKSGRFFASLFEATPKAPAVLGTNLIHGQPLNSNIQDAQIWISESLWQERFRKDKDILGGTLVLAEQAYTIIGVYQDVLIHSYEKIEAAQIWIHQNQENATQSDNAAFSNNAGTHYFRPHDKGIFDENILKDWWANYILSDAFPDASADRLEGSTTRISIEPFRHTLIGESYSMIVILPAAVSVLLAMAALNLLNLLLAHYQSRRKEFAMQLTLGSSISRLRRMLILENLPSFIAAAIVGLLVAAWTLDNLHLLLQDSYLISESIPISIEAVLLSLCIVTLIAVLFGLLGAQNLRQQNLSQLINSSGKGTPQQHKHRLNTSLMTIQVCLTTCLVSIAVVLASHSIKNLSGLLGFEPGSAYMARYHITDDAWRDSLNAYDNYSDSELKKVQWQLASKIQGKIPPADFVLTGSLPIWPNNTLSFIKSNADAVPFLYATKVLTDNYFTVYGIKFLAGDAPTQQELENNESLIVIDTLMAEEMFPDETFESILGRNIKWLKEEEELNVTVVGIVNHSSVPGSITADFPTLYTYRMTVGSDINIPFLLKNGAIFDTHESLRNLPVDGRLEFERVISQQLILDDFTYTQRSALKVVLIVVALTLFLAALGLSGLTQITTNEKRFELAIRLATGASRIQLLQLIYKDTLWILLIGLGLGTTLSILAYWQVQAIFTDLPPFSGLAIMTLISIISLTVLMSVGLPAWRIISKNPMRSLQQ